MIRRNSRIARLTKLGHACVLLESVDGSKILLDPGDLSGNLTGLPRLDAILITHAHPDHVDPAKLAEAAAGQDIPVIGGPGTEEIVRGVGLSNYRELREGEHEVAGVSVIAIAAEHATIYDGFPLPKNFALEFGDQVFTPGDSFAKPTRDIDVLLAPTGGPWMKLSEAINYIREVDPRRVVPFHDGGLAPAHRALHIGLMKRFGSDGTAIHDLDVGDVLAI